MFLQKNKILVVLRVVDCGNAMELSDSKKHSLIFLFAFVAAGTIIATLVFPFWNLIREDVFEEVEILSNVNDRCYAETKDLVPKTIDNCSAQPGDQVTIKFGRDLAWAEIVTPEE